MPKNDGFKALLAVSLTLGLTLLLLVVMNRLPAWPGLAGGTLFLVLAGGLMAGLLRVNPEAGGQDELAGSLPADSRAETPQPAGEKEAMPAWLAGLKDPVEEKTEDAPGPGTAADGPEQLPSWLHKLKDPEQEAAGDAGSEEQLPSWLKKLG
jgi:hypothetical protein